MIKKGCVMDKPVFTLGLTMAGAISAGSYTAGVIDFLLEALKEWENEKINNPEVYPYDVKINAISGASAGGMTAAIMTAMLGGKFETTDNNLYKSWVEDIHIDRLLANKDLIENNAIHSILDSTVLEEITQQALNVMPNEDEWPSYVSEYLHVLISVANLHGVPYHVEFQGETEDKEKEIKQHGMLMHEDFMHFIFSKEDPVIQNVRFADSAIWLNSKNYQDQRWKVLGNSALASGAFPLGFASRQLRRNRANYDNREWLINLDCISCDGNEQVKGYQYSTIKPSWPKEMSTQYTFNGIDGGLMNNEPFELLTSLLSDEKCISSNDHPFSALLMIDPFPQNNLLDLTQSIQKLDILGVFKGMFSALKNQARFKLEEIKRSKLNDSQLRFLISPTRSNKKGLPIASGSLDGFGGFLSRGFREHDFFLGRRNCQYFLSQHFTLHRTHPLYKDVKKDLYSTIRKKEDNIPIIPLCGTAKETIERPTWPKYTYSELEKLQRQIKKRITALSERAIENHIDGFWSRQILKVLLWFKKDAIAKSISMKIAEDLKKNGLLN